MPDLWMDVDAALSEVPVNLLPLIDDTDFKTRETGITYDQAGMDLVWNFVTTAGAMTQTAVTPTTGGDYDWTNQGDGMYSIEIPAAAGASINNDTEGFGWFTGYATGVLPWRGPVIGFRAAALNNALIDGGDVLDVSLTEIGGVAQSATDLKDLVDTGYDPVAHKVQGVVLTDGCTTNADMVGTDGALLAANVNVAAGIIESNLIQMGGVAQSATDLKDFADEGYDPATNKVQGVVTVDTTTTNSDMRGTDSAALAATALSTATWTNARAGYLDNINGHTAQTGDSYARIGTNGASLTALPWNSAWDTEVQSECNDALVALNLDHLVAVADSDDVVDNSIIAKLAASGAAADWSTFVNTTDSLQAIRDNQTAGSGDWTENEKTEIKTVLGITNTGTPDSTPSDGALNNLQAGVNVTKVEGVSLGSKAGDNFNVFFNNGDSDSTKKQDDVGVAGSGYDPDTKLIDGTLTMSNAVKKIAQAVIGTRTLSSSDELSCNNYDNTDAELVMKKTGNTVTRTTG